MYVISHAFSRRNAGDGLLVDLTLEALEAAGIPRERCCVVALDAESFGDLANVVQAPGEAGAKVSTQLAQAAMALAGDVALTSFGNPSNGSSLARLFADAEGIIAVGGGYLVADSPVRQAGVTLNHLLQIRMAGRSSAPCVYLPQSIGPLEGPAGLLCRKALESIDRIYLRDDESVSELGLPNVRRCADLAVLKLARDLDRIACAGSVGRMVVVPRDLPRAGRLHDGLAQLRALAPDALWAVQADVAGPRSDAAFCERLGVSAAGPLAQVLQQAEAGVVVSVRLHGAIGAMLAGHPAIHLAYERKGQGAYEDLGLAEYVHDARDFDAQLVARQAAELRQNPDAFWARVREAAPKLRQDYEELVAHLRWRMFAPGEAPAGRYATAAR